MGRRGAVTRRGHLSVVLVFRVRAELNLMIEVWQMDRH
jgi:hypothetical protein